MYSILRSPWNFLKNRSYLGAQSNFNKYKKNEITPCKLSDHNAIKLEFNNKNSSRKIHKQLETEKHIAQHTSD
jgi:hypothetical protein